MEYALADCSLAGMAREFGDRGLAAASARQAGNWRNVLNPATGHVGPRTADGTYASSDPMSSTGFTDSAIQSTFLVPHDVPGLAAAVGGRTALERRLDEFFVFDGVRSDPETTARQKWVGEDRVAPADQPMFHTPWMYAWLDSPWKTSPGARALAERLRARARTGCRATTTSVPDRRGTCSRRSGSSRPCPAATTTCSARPLFERATMRLDRRFYGRGAVLDIRAPGARRRAGTSAGVRIDRRAQRRSWVEHGALRGGLRIDHALEDEPDEAWGRGERPPSGCGR
jgi:putative alpha-1,2-mannosidase